jgi:predicted DNA-binding transcriptional regulator YafY
VAGVTRRPTRPRPTEHGPAAGGRLLRGRPRGAFTQHRRYAALRSLLHQHPKGLTIYELASQLHVTPRSMRRYLAELRRELDIEPDRPHGGRAQRWRIAPAEVLRRVAVRRTQAYALLATRTLFAPLRGSTLYEEIDLAAQHLVGIARRPGRGPNAGVADAKLEERFVYLPFAPKDYSSRSEALDDLFQAVADLRPLSCRCPRPADAKLERLVIHPYAMVLYKDAVYCIGRDTGRDVVRTFPLDQLHDTACSTSERFTLPSDFRIDQYWQGQFGIWRGGEPTEVVVDFEPAVADYLRTRKVHPSQRIEPLRGGGVRLRLCLGELTEVATWVLGFGAMAKVQQPPELAKRVHAELEAACRRYVEPPAAIGKAALERRRRKRLET